MAAASKGSLGVFHAKCFSQKWSLLLSILEAGTCQKEGDLEYLLTLPPVAPACLSDSICIFSGRVCQCGMNVAQLSMQRESTGSSMVEAISPTARVTAGESCNQGDHNDWGPAKPLRGQITGPKEGWSSGGHGVGP